MLFKIIYQSKNPVADDEQGKNPNRVHLQRLDKITMQGFSAGPAQSASRAIIKTKVTKRAKRKMVLVRINKEKGNNGS